MRKNNGGGKNLKKLYFTTYKVQGLNLDRLLNLLRKRGIALYDVKKRGIKTLVLTVNGYDNEKFFAITRELCYNVKKLKDKGKFYPFLYLFRNIGVVIGVAIFIAIAVCFNDRIFAFSFSGTGSVYHREVTEFLNEKGVVIMSRFSDLDLKSLEDEILAKNQGLSFVSCVKNGYRLEINLALATDGTDVLTGKVDKVLSDVDGVVEQIKIYRGTALVNEGDLVQKGDLLVGGYCTVGDKVIEMNVVACITLITTDTVVYSSQKDGEENLAVIYAKEKTEKDSFSEEVIKSFDGKDYLYTVTLKSRHVIKVG